MKEFFSIFSSIFSLLSSQPIDTISIENIINFKYFKCLIFMYPLIFMIEIIKYFNQSTLLFIEFIINHLTDNFIK